MRPFYQRRHSLIIDYNKIIMSTQNNLIIVIGSVKQLGAGVYWGKYVLRFHPHIPIQVSAKPHTYLYCSKSVVDADRYEYGNEIGQEYMRTCWMFLLHILLGNKCLKSSGSHKKHLVTGIPFQGLPAHWWSCMAGGMVECLVFSAQVKAWKQV